MSPRNLLNLGMLIAVGLLILVVVYEPGKTPPPKQPPITTLKQDDINHVHITRTTDEDIILEKQNGKWQMLQPYALPTNEFRVESLLRLVEAASHSKHNLKDLDPAKFGLDKPRATITFNKKIRIGFGKSEPMQHRRYISVNDSMHLITDTFYYQVAGKATNFASHALLPAESKLVALTLPGLKLELKDGKWQVTPKPENYSADSITELLNEWHHSQAIGLKKVAATKGKAAIRIRLEGKDSPIEFILQKNEAETFMTRKDSNIQYTIASDVADRLLKLPPPVKEEKVDTVPGMTELQDKSTEHTKDTKN